jgi:uncharacterized protein (TIRG00374 family)
MEQPGPKKDLHQRLMKPLLWSVLAAVAIYGGSMIASDLEAVGDSIAKLGFIGWVVVLALSLVNYGLRFLRWEMYLRRLFEPIPVMQSMAYYIGGFAFTTTPGKAGEAVRSLYLKRHGMPFVHSLAAFFVERVVDLVAMVLLALLTALTFPDYQWPVLIVTLLLLAMLPVIHAPTLHSFLDKLFSRFSSDTIRRGGKRFLELLRSSSGLLRSTPLYIGLALALVAWGAEGVAFYIILEQLNIETTIALAVGIYSVSVLAGALSFIPGGLGSTEAVMILLLKLVGADTPSAVAATLVCRLATLWFAVVIGGAVLAGLELAAKNPGK